MLKKHIVLFESKNYEWIAYSTTGSDAKRILSVNNKYNISTQTMLGLVFGCASIILISLDDSTNKLKKLS